MKNLFILIILCLMPVSLVYSQTVSLTEENNEMFTLENGNYRIEIEAKGFCFDIYNKSGKKIAPAHPVSGLQFGSVADVDINITSDSLQEMTQGKVFDIESTSLVSKEADRAVFQVVNTEGDKAMVQIYLLENRVKFSVTPDKVELNAILLRTASIAPVYGLSDHGALGRESAEVSGFSSDYMGARTCQDIHHEGRLISNFVIHPKQGLAAINVEPRKKFVRFTDSEATHGSSASKEMDAMYYIIGDPKTIYQELQEIREVEGYPFLKPKYDLFGVGWEAFGALGWTTSAKTVEENINTYLSLGYPLSWMVIGSGFWPSGSSELWGTTSFGMWDKEKYPDPKAFLKRMEEKGLSTLLGLRISIRKGNPYAIEAEKKGFLLLDENGEPIDFYKRGWPTYILDFENPQAIDWYVKQCEKWTDYGVDGFKEDLMFYLNEMERDDKCDEVNRRLSEAGAIIMLRNNYLGSPGDLHRYNDFNFYESQDRGPINGLCLSYSGFPYAYPNDPAVYGLANTQRRSYQWLLGESLMAFPLYGDDYATANARDVYLPEGKWIDYDNGKMYTGPTTLEEFPMPIGKTPLFVGGKGIVVEEKFERLFAYVYPIQNKTEMTLHHKDGSVSQIQVKVDSWDTNLVQVFDDSGQQVKKFEKHHGAIVFSLEKGTEYTVKSIPMPKPVSLVKPKKKT